MKSVYLTVILIFIYSFVHAQNVTGLFSGTLVNDSTKKAQQYELALTEYRNKIWGYSYTTFVVHDTFYYSIKRVKGTKKDKVLEVEDVEMLSNNFPQKPDRGVHVINTISLTENVDTLQTMNGNWRTTQTKKFYSIHGSLDLKKDNDSTHSQLINHLMELRQIPVVRNKQEEKFKVESSRFKKKEEGDTKIKMGNSKIKRKDEEGKEKVVVSNTKNKEVAIPAFIQYTERTNRPLQDVTVAADSIVLTFYDNGVVDGDSISVYINERNILEKQKLTEAAVKRTIQLKDFSEDALTLTLVAENLGTIPPNTGLLIIQDGETRYHINFSADLQTNARLTIRKKNYGRN